MKSRSGSVVSKQQWFGVSVLAVSALTLLPQQVAHAAQVGEQHSTQFSFSIAAKPCLRP